MRKKRKKRAVKKPSVVVAFAWYKPEEWEAWKGVCPEFEDTHAGWERGALESFQNIQRSGVKLHKVVLDLEAFLLWCAEHDQERNSAARSRYASELLHRQSTEAE